MVDHKVPGKKTASNVTLRRRVGDLFIFLGVLLLFSVALTRVKVILASQEMTNRLFLVYDLKMQPPLPDQVELKTSLPRSENQLEEADPEAPVYPQPPAIGAPITSPTNQPVKTPPETTIQAPELEAQIEAVPVVITNGVYLPGVYSTDTDQTSESPVDNPAAEPGGEDVGSSPIESSGAIVRLIVPSLQIDRTVVPLGLKKTSGKQLVWNTDALFSTNNRADLVGQMITSPNPGEGGNIVLVGHNYNNGWVYPTGVFVNLANLQVGSSIVVVTESGKKFEYIVQLVKKVPWRLQDENELQKHQKFLWPTENEQLTLVTCGGANFGVWNARIYAVAKPTPQVVVNQP